MDVANVRIRARVIPDGAEGCQNLLSRSQPELLEEFEVVSSQILAVLLQESVLFVRQGDVAELCRDESVHMRATDDSRNSNGKAKHSLRICSSSHLKAALESLLSGVLLVKA